MIKRTEFALLCFLYRFKGWNSPVSHLVCVQQKSSSLGISLPLIWMTRSWFTHSVFGASEYPPPWLSVTVSLFLCFSIDFCIGVAVWLFWVHSLLSTNGVSIIEKASNAERGRCFLWCMMLWWFHHLFWFITLTLLQQYNQITQSILPVFCVGHTTYERPMTVH